MVHGLVTAGPFTIDSIINFFSSPCAWHAIASEQSSTARLGLVGLNCKSFAYSLRR